MAPPSKLPRRPKSEYVIQTVANALRLLETFREGEAEELGVTELSRRLSLHKNNVFRLLATLEERGYVDQTPETDRYRLGVRCQDLGHAYSRGSALARHGRTALEQLSAETGETCHLAVMLDLEVSHIDGEASKELVLSGLRIGQRLPLHGTASGKVLLASGAQELWDQYERKDAIDGHFRQLTEKTITDRDKLFDHLNGVGSSGTALDLEECAAGLVCAAAPVLDASGRTVAALSLSAPTSRVAASTLREDLAPVVTTAAESLSERLGYQPE